MTQHRIGIDLGGTKIEIVVAGARRQRAAAATGSTRRTAIRPARGIAGLVRDAEAQLGVTATVGIGIPGVISPATGLVKNANSIALNGHPFDNDISAAARPRGAAGQRRQLLRPVRGHRRRRRRPRHGVRRDPRHRLRRRRRDRRQGAARRATASPANGATTRCPGRSRDEMPGPRCWCGQSGCLETWIAGPALAARLRRRGRARRLRHPRPCRRRRGASRGPRSTATPTGWRAGWRHVINLLDPDVIVLGGGLSNMEHLYPALPPLVTVYVFSDFVRTPIVRNRHGDLSGVRGAAWLWPAGG